MVEIPIRDGNATSSSQACKRSITYCHTDNSQENANDIEIDSQAPNADVPQQIVLSDPVLASLNEVKQTVKILQENIPNRRDLKSVVEMIQNTMGGQINSALGQLEKRLNNLPTIEDIENAATETVRDKLAELEEKKQKFENDKNTFLDELRSQLTSEKDTALDELRSQLTSEKDTALDELRSQLMNEKDTALDELRGQLTSEKDTALDELRGQLTSEKDTALDELRSQLMSEKNTALNELQSRLIGETDVVRRNFNNASEELAKTRNKLQQWEEFAEQYVPLRTAMESCPVFSDFLQENNLHETQDFIIAIGKSIDFAKAVYDYATKAKQVNPIPVTEEEKRVYKAINNCYHYVWPEISSDIFVLPGKKNIDEDFKKIPFDKNEVSNMQNPRDRTSKYTQMVYVPLLMSQKGTVYCLAQVKAGNN